MKHLLVDMNKIEIVECLYHRTYMTHPLPTLKVSIDGEFKEYNLRWRAVKRDNMYHSRGLKCALVVYDGIVLAYELTADGSLNSLINIQNMIDMLKKEEIEDGWYFDYEKFYRLDAVANDSFIGTQMVRYLDPIHLTYSNTISITYTDVIVVNDVENQRVVLQSPPISNNLDKKVDALKLFDNDQKLKFVSLSCLLNICGSITKMYGADIIERFDIPQYMIRHKTVNLSKLPQYVKDNSSTAEIPINMLSFVMGLMHKENDFSNIRELTRILKMICRSGIVDIRDTNSDNIYKNPIRFNKIDLSSLKSNNSEIDQ